MKFRPEDFHLESLQYHMNNRRVVTIDEAAEISNKLIQAHLATLPKVYGNKCENMETYQNQPEYAWTLHKGKHETHTALLWGITEIKKNCEHEWESNDLDFKKCCLCGVKMVAHWKPA
jgi:hypothetical protein